MKKTLALILALCMMISCVACGKRIDKPEDPIVVEQKPYEDMTLAEQLEFMSSREREYVASSETGKLAPAKDPTTGKYGYINIYGDWIIKPEYDQAGCFNGDVAPILDQYNEYEYIYRDGSIFMSVYNRKVPFTAARHFYDFFGACVIDSGYEQNKVYIALDGISQIFASKLPNTNGVKYENKQFFAIATPFKNGIAVAMKRTNASVLESNDNNITKLTSKEYWQSAYVIDQSGNIFAALPAGYDVFDYSLNDNDTIIVRDMTKEEKYYGVCDLEGNLIIPCSYHMIEYCDNGMFLATNDQGFLGYINKSGENATEFKYQAAYPFSDGLAAVKENDLWGFITTKGEYAIEPVWDDVAYLRISDYDFSIGKAAFCSDVAAVKSGDYWALINKTGDIIDATYCPAAQTPAYSYTSDNIVVFEEYKDGIKTGGFGLIDTEGHLVLEPFLAGIGLFN